MTASATGRSPTKPCSLEELEGVIKKAMKKTGVQKEMDLCPFLYDRVGHFSPAKFLRLKDRNRRALRDLIKNEILEVKPYHLPTKRVQQSEKQSYIGKSLETCIEEATSKLGLQKETSLCKYLPYNEGHIHHFTFLKMKSSNPIHLRNLIKTNILDKKPQRYSPKPRKKYKTAEESSTPHEKETNFADELDWVIFQAMRKTGLNLENEAELCRYFPEDYSYFHPFTYESLKKNNPKELICLIKKHILGPKHLKFFSWKEKDYAPPLRMNSTPKQEATQKTEASKIDQLLNMTGQLIQSLHDRETVQESPRQSSSFITRYLNEYSVSEKCIQFIQNELIKSILDRRIDSSLWMNFGKLVHMISD